MWIGETSIASLLSQRITLTGSTIHTARTFHRTLRPRWPPLLPLVLAFFRLRRQRRQMRVTLGLLSIVVGASARPPLLLLAACLWIHSAERCIGFSHCQLQPMSLDSIRP